MPCLVPLSMKPSKQLCNIQVPAVGCHWLVYPVLLLINSLPVSSSCPSMFPSCILSIRLFLSDCISFKNANGRLLFVFNNCLCYPALCINSSLIMCFVHEMFCILQRKHNFAVGNPSSIPLLIVHISLPIYIYINLDHMSYLGTVILVCIYTYLFFGMLDMF